jgi:hypothetical protein
MGTNCGSHPDPDTSNVCSGALGDTVSGRNFCSLSGPAGDDNRDGFCGDIGDSEWYHSGSGSSCQYNDCNESQDFGGGCCNGCCGIAGSSVTCTRSSFKGDPTLCCWRDLACNPPTNKDNACFEDSTQMRTCDPTNRALTSSACQEKVFDYCTGANDSTTAWQGLWTNDNITITGADGSTMKIDQPCYKALYRNLYSNPQNGVESSAACLAEPGVGEPSAAGWKWSQELISAVFAKYISQGGMIDAQEGDPGANIELNQLLYKICLLNPGLCQQSLNNYCSNVTVQDLVNHIETMNWCGCNMQPEQYSTYTNLYQVNPECTPMCNQSGVIPLPSSTNAGGKVCEQSLCIIDNVAISLAQSRVGNGGTGINFSQICSSCGGGSSTTSTASSGGITLSNQTTTSQTCRCVLSNLTFAAVDSTIGSINISQSCGDASCYQQQTINGVVQNVPVPCNSDANYNPYAEYQAKLAAAEASAANSRNYKILLIFVIVIVIIVVIMFVVRPRDGAENSMVLSRPPHKAMPFTELPDLPGKYLSAQDDLLS